MNTHFFNQLKSSKNIIVPISNSDEFRRIQGVFFSIGAGYTSNDNETLIQQYVEYSDCFKSIKCSESGKLSVTEEAVPHHKAKDSFVITAFQAAYNSLSIFSDRFGKMD